VLQHNVSLFNWKRGPVPPNTRQHSRTPVSFLSNCLDKFRNIFLTQCPSLLTTALLRSKSVSKKK